MEIYHFKMKAFFDRQEKHYCIEILSEDQYVYYSACVKTKLENKHKNVSLWKIHIGKFLIGI